MFGEARRKYCYKRSRDTPGGKQADFSSFVGVPALWAFGGSARKDVCEKATVR